MSKTTSTQIKDQKKRIKQEKAETFKFFFIKKKFMND